MSMNAPQSITDSAFANASSSLVEKPKATNVIKSPSKRGRVFKEHDHINYDKCYCCGKESEKMERHHFPIPHAAFGTEYVNCCVQCHDLIDRHRFVDWHSFIQSGVDASSLSDGAIELLQALVTTQTKDLDDYYGDEKAEYVEKHEDTFYDLDEDAAFHIMKECSGVGRAFAMKLIAHCFLCQ